MTFQSKKYSATKVITGEPMIEITGLVKRYGSTVAVDHVDLTVMTGEIFGILGPNGAGKTTTLEMIEGLRNPDAGEILLAGVNAVTQSARVRQMIGVQLQTTALFDYLNAAELIELFAGLYGVDGSEQRIDELLGQVGLLEKKKSRVDELSGGQRQRLSITLALVNQPRVVFLDEPTTGLDPGARRELWQTILNVRASGTTVVLTTHYMEEAELLCDRVAVMDRGKVIACDTPAALVRRLGDQATISARVADVSTIAGSLSSLPAIIASTCDERRLELRTTDVQATLVALLALVDRLGVVLADLNARQSTLEDVFLSLTGRAYEQPGDKPEAATAKAGPGRRNRGSRGI